MNRATGLLVIEVVNSNPNGNPDQENDPRVRDDLRGLISPVSVKRKIRDLVDDKDGPAWRAIAASFEHALDPESYQILESRGRNRKEIEGRIKDGTFLSSYWDARIFGNTYLEKGLSDEYIRTGVVQFGLGMSVSPVHIDRFTTTSKSGVQEGKDRGMAPLAYRIVAHGAYVMPFFVNATAAEKSGCSETDLALLLRLLPYVYSETASYLRSQVNVRRAWYVEHRSPLGSVPDFQILQALTPIRASQAPSAAWSDYSVPETLPDDLAKRVLSVTDLVARAYDAVAA